MMEKYQLVAEYLVLPFPEIQPDYWLKVELWKRNNAYRPVVYIRDYFRLPQSSLMSRKHPRKKYALWVEDDWETVFPENCEIRNVEESKAIDIVLEIFRCKVQKEDLGDHLKPYVVFHDEDI